jgi:uncharacterized 2Fe-2S/4Fe-4S cluster protein (DUF4445 family)
MNVYVTNQNIHLQAQPGENLLQVLRRGGVDVEAPCGGGGKCGKCKVWVDGEEQLACHYAVEKDITVHLPEKKTAEVLTRGLELRVQADGTDRYALAFDLGTTTVVAYLMDGSNGQILARASCVNPQSRFGADVISRIQYAMDGEGEALSRCIRDSLAELTHLAAGQAGVDPGQITAAALVGNTAMHHLLLGIDPKPLTTPPYMPSVSEAMTVAADFLPVAPGTELRILPNIAGFVGADTVGCLVATEFDQLEDVTLMIDIGTNGEMVLGNRDSYLACSTAAGPAFEGAKISCGMRGAAGAVDHVWVENGEVRHSVIGGGEAVGLCGSGLMDLVAVLLQIEEMDETGRLEEEDYTIPGTTVTLTQKDVREVQLAKAAIRAGIELMCRKRGITPEDIQKVYLAGAFGSFMNPASACAIGMIPPCLLDKIQSIGNAAGTGACACALSRGAYGYSSRLAEKAEFLELASMVEFNDCYVDCLLFEEEE